MKKPTTSFLYYDSTCKFCTSSKSLAFKIEPKKVKYVPLNSEIISNFKRKLHLSKKEAENLMFYIDKQGTTYYGSNAFFAFLRELRGPYVLIGYIGKLPIISWISAKLYHCIAMNRYTISIFFT